MFNSDVAVGYVDGNGIEMVRKQSGMMSKLMVHFPQHGGSQIDRSH